MSQDDANMEMSGSESDSEDDSMEESKEQDVEGEDEEVDQDEAEDGAQEVYLPGKALEEGEKLVCDQSAYIMLHQAQTGAPCLSFDVVPDTLGSGRESFPMTAYLVAGTQAARAHTNK